MSEKIKSVYSTVDAQIKCKSTINETLVTVKSENQDGLSLSNDLPFGYSKVGDVLCYDDKPISSYVDFLYRVRDEEQKNWSFMVGFYDLDYKRKELLISNADLYDTSKSIIQNLASEGLEIYNSKKLIDYLKSCKSSKRARLIRQTGWYNGNFILPDITVGISEELYIPKLKSNSHEYSVSGELSDWQDNIGKYIPKNDRLILSVCLAFSGPLQKILGQENGGIHLIGKSSSGKSTIARVATSIWGKPEFMKNWRTTDNGLEYLAAERNDTFLVLDELGQVNVKIAQGMNYLLGNGSGKNRSKVTGGLQMTPTWNIQVLSTGEKSFKDIALEAGVRYNAGEDVRMISLPAIGEDYLYGCFQQIYDFADGAAMSEHLKKASQCYYGTPSIKFLEEIQRCTREYIYSEFEKFQTYLNEEFRAVDGQVKRVINRFSMIGCAGVLASNFGIIPCESRDIYKSISLSLKDWLNYRGGSHALEEDALLVQVKTYMEKYNESRFKQFSDCFQEVHQKSIQAGFVRYKKNGEDYEIDRYYVYPEIFKSDICSGFDFKWAREILYRKGWLETTMSKTIRLRSGPRKMYTLLPAIWL